MKKPNFFIVGAPKCGTTALAEYLSSHPNIYMSRPKEPCFFAEEFQVYIKTWSQYLSLFEETTEQHKIIGEASVHYLCSAQAIEKIYAYNPDAKIIAMVRNPVDLVYSYHSQLLYNAEDEDESDFEKAWHLQPCRKQGLNLPKLCNNPEALQYKNIGNLGTQIEKLLAIFPSKQVKVIVFEDFKTSTKTVYEEVLSFLNLTSDKRDEFPKINANKKHKIALLGKLTEKPPKALLKGADFIKKHLGIQSFRIMPSIRQANLEYFDRTPLRENFRTYLIAEFKEEVEKLSRILNKDLNIWMN